MVAALRSEQRAIASDAMHCRVEWHLVKLGNLLWEDGRELPLAVAPFILPASTQRWLRIKPACNASSGCRQQALLPKPSPCDGAVVLIRLHRITVTNVRFSETVRMRMACDGIFKQGYVGCSWLKLIPCSVIAPGRMLQLPSHCFRLVYFIGRIVWFRAGVLIAGNGSKYATAILKASAQERALQIEGFTTIVNAWLFTFYSLPVQQLFGGLFTGVSSLKLINCDR